MPSLRAQIVLELDGAPVSGFPAVLSIQGDVAQTLDHDLATGGTETMLDTRVGTLRALVLRADQTVDLQLNGCPKAVTLAPGGLLLLLNVSQPGDAAGPLNTVSNNSGASAEVKGVALGSP